MRIAYFDCFSGISGDMIVGALIDSGMDFNLFRKELNKLRLKGYEIKANKVIKNGISATKFNVIENINAIENKGLHEERSLTEINKIVDDSKLDKEIKGAIKIVFNKIAVAESKIHNKPINKIHFHEIGAIDTIIDIAGAVIGIKKAGIEKVYCSKINVGTGFVKFSHGIFPVPAPATAEILKGAQIYHNNTKSELVTPTGAAIITAIAEGFGGMPLMKLEKTGYGAGASELKHPNLLRVFIGELDEEYKEDIVNVIESNIDDMNPQFYGYVIEKLLKKGALDVFLTSILMKKNRPGIKLSVISTLENTDEMVGIILGETTALGVRIYQTKRKKLDVLKKRVKTGYGEIRMKIAKLNDAIKNISPEYEDCKTAAEKNNVAIKKVYDEAKAQFLIK